MSITFTGALERGFFCVRRRLWNIMFNSSAWASHTDTHRHAHTHTYTHTHTLEEGIVSWAAGFHVL